MERIKSLNGYQKGLLLFMLVTAVVFAVIYPITISRVGYEYYDVILVPAEENGNTLYSGKIKGQPACFTVSDNTVVFQYGDTIYGPYIVKEDPMAVPKDHEMSRSMTGMEVREGDDILFRGGVITLADSYMFFDEDGISDSMFSISYVAGDGIERDEQGNPIDRMKPSLSTIYALTDDPKLEHKGEGIVWFAAVFICILNGVSILFADELFRFHLLFRIRDAEFAEPSDWEMMGRYMGWTVVAVMALVLFITGLK